MTTPNFNESPPHPLLLSCSQYHPHWNTDTRLQGFPYVSSQGWADNIIHTERARNQWRCCYHEASYCDAQMGSRPGKHPLNTSVYISSYWEAISWQTCHFFVKRWLPYDLLNVHKRKYGFPNSKPKTILQYIWVSLHSASPIWIQLAAKSTMQMHANS